MIMKTLSAEESNTLYALLKSEQKPFEEIVSDFNSNFPHVRHFVVCSSLILLLQAACDDEAEKYERAFILQLLGSDGPSSGKEFLKQSAADYIKGFGPSSHAFPQREQLQQQYGDKIHQEPVKSLVADPDVPHGCDANSPEFDPQPGAKPKVGSGDKDDTVIGLLQNLSIEGLSPQWIRPLPPRLPVQEGELVWLNPDDNHELLWDYGMCVDTSGGAAVRDLIAKALKGALVPQQQERHPIVGILTRHDFMPEHVLGLYPHINSHN